MAEYETLLYEEDGGVAVVTMNRPEVHNAFNEKMQDELQHAWRSLRENREVRAVILTGAGDEAFNTGIDREEAIQQSYLDKSFRTRTGSVSSPFMFNDCGKFILPKENDLWKPVISAVNGIACAGALYLLGESDIVIAAEHATFFDPHVTYGMVAGFESTHLLQKLPLGETLRLVLLGNHERMSAERARELGLVSEVVPLSELMDRAMWVARAIASAPASAIEGTLKAAWAAHEKTRRQAIAEVSTYVMLGTGRDNIADGQDVFQGDRIDWQLR